MDEWDIIVCKQIKDISIFTIQNNNRNMPQMGIIIRTYIHYGAQRFTSLKADSTIYDVNDWVLYTFIL